MYRYHQDEPIDDWHWSDLNEIDIMFRIGIILILFVCLLVLLSAICFFKQREVKLKFQIDAINEIVVQRRESKLSDNANEHRINANGSIHNPRDIPQQHANSNKLSIPQNISSESISSRLSTSVIYESEADNRCSPNLPTLITMQASNISEHFPNIIATINVVDIR